MGGKANLSNCHDAGAFKYSGFAFWALVFSPINIKKANVAIVFVIVVEAAKYVPITNALVINEVNIKTR